MTLNDRLCWRQFGKSALNQSTGNAGTIKPDGAVSLDSTPTRNRIRKAGYQNLRLVAGRSLCLDSGSMNLDKRICQIEQRQNAQQSCIRISRFIVDPGADIFGYECEGQIIRREPNESLEALHSRSVNTVLWPTQMAAKDFHPLAK